MNKKELAITLSKLKTFEKPIAKLEQYQLDSEIAAEVLWFAFMNNEIKGKIVADFGCGTGILGVGALLLGAKKVFFVDIDNSALLIARQNITSLNLQNAILSHKEVIDFNEKVDTVIQNPPFGVQVPYADKPFLEKAMQVSNAIYSFHKIESKDFIKNLSSQHNFSVKNILEFTLKLKRTQKFHEKEKYEVKVGCWRLKRNI